MAENQPYKEEYYIPELISGTFLVLRGNYLLQMPLQLYNPCPNTIIKDFSLQSRVITLEPQNHSFTFHSTRQGVTVITLNFSMTY